MWYRHRFLVSIDRFRMISLYGSSRTFSGGMGLWFQRLSAFLESWLVVWNMTVIFPFSWECHHPSWRTHIFQRDRSTTNQESILEHGACYVRAMLDYAVDHRVFQTTSQPAKKATIMTLDTYEWDYNKNRLLVIYLYTYYIIRNQLYIQLYHWMKNLIYLSYPLYNQSYLIKLRPTSNCRQSRQRRSGLRWSECRSRSPCESWRRGWVAGVSEIIHITRYVTIRYRYIQ